MDYRQALQTMNAQLQEIAELRLIYGGLQDEFLRTHQQLQRSEGEAKNAVERSRAAERLLEGLTPGGSEFYGNPTMCAQWVADRLSTLAKLVLQRKAAEQQAAQAGDLLRTFATAARKLIVYRSKNTLNFQLEKADDFIQELAIAVDNAESFLEGKG